MHFGVVGGVEGDQGVGFIEECLVKNERFSIR